MTDILLDGKGRGYRAGVDHDGRLETVAYTKGEIAYHSEHYTAAYGIYGRRNIVTENTNEGMLYLYNSGADALIISNITFSTSSASAKFEVFFDPTGVTGGNVRLPLQLNRRSAVTPNITVLDGESDLTATTSTAMELMDVRLNKNTFNWDTKDSIILPYGKSIYIQVEAAAASDRCRCNVFCFIDSHIKET
jgi:hypothetical protein